MHTGVRWHVRAYDDERKAFRNFALQRMEDPYAIDASAPAAASEDGDWVELAILRVIPNPKLNAHQQQLVARDFGMLPSSSGPAWTVELRRCLIGYFAAKYGLDRDEAPLRQRIILDNADTVRQWLMPIASG